MTDIWQKSRAVFRSTPLRLTIALVFLFALVSFLSLGATYFVIRDSLDQAMRSDSSQKVVGFQAAPSGNAIAALIEAEGAATDPERRILSYTSADGRHYGNGTLALAKTGFNIVDDPGVEDQSDWPYLVLTTDIYGGQLGIANSREQIGDLGELFINRA